MRDRSLRPVAIEYFEPKPARREIALYRGERVRRRRRQQATRALVAVDLFADEIVAAEVAHVDDEPVDDGGGIDEARRDWRLRAARAGVSQQQRERGDGNGVHGDKPYGIRQGGSAPIRVLGLPVTMSQNNPLPGPFRDNITYEFNKGEVFGPAATAGCASFPQRGE